MCDGTYNGWVNRETWTAALHLTNDEGLYLESVTLATASPDCLREWVEAEAETVYFPEDGETPAEWIRPLLANVGSLWRVDWDEVAASLLDV
jgi:hypothetical protein